MCRQHQKHDQDRKAEGQQQPGRGFAKGCRLAQRHDSAVGGQDISGQPRHLGQGRAQRQGRGQAGTDGDRPHLRLAAQFRGNRPLGQTDEGGNRHHLAVTGPHEDPFQIGWVIHRIGGGHQFDVKAFVVQEHRAHRAPVQHRLQRLAHAVDVDAQIGGAGAVHFDEQLRLCRVIAQAHLTKGGVLFHRLDQLARAVGQGGVVIAHHGKGQTVARAADAQRIGLDRKGADADDAAQLAVDLVHDLLLAAAALGPVGQRDHHEAPVVRPLSGNGEDIGHLAPGAQRLQQRLDVAHLAIGIIQRHALRRLDAEQHQRAVFGRGQFLAQAGEEQGRDGGKDQRRRHRHKRGRQRQTQRGRVEAGQSVAQPHHRAARVMGGVHGAQPAAGQHRAERQGGD